MNDAHSHTIRNRSEIARSHICVCLCCKARFKAAEVTGYIDSGETALCPCCGCDAVVGDSSCADISPQAVEELNKKYFGYDD